MAPTAIRIQRDLEAGWIHIGFAGRTADLQLRGGSPRDVRKLVINGVVFKLDDNPWVEWCMWLVLGDEPTGFHYYSAEYLGTRTEHSEIPASARSFVIAVLAHALDEDRFPSGVKCKALQSLERFLRRWPEHRSELASVVEAFHAERMAARARGAALDDELLGASARARVEAATDNERPAVVEELLADAERAPSCVDGIFRAYELGTMAAVAALIALSTRSTEPAVRASRNLARVHEQCHDDKLRMQIEHAMLDAIERSDNLAVLAEAFDVVKAARRVVATATAFERIVDRLFKEAPDKALVQVLLRGLGSIGLERLHELPVPSMPQPSSSDSLEPSLLRALTQPSIFDSPAARVLFRWNGVGERLMSRGIAPSVDSVAEAIAAIVNAAQCLEGTRFVLDARNKGSDGDRAVRWLCEQLEGDRSPLQRVCETFARVSLGPVGGSEMRRLVNIIIEACSEEVPAVRSAALAALERQLEIDAPLGNQCAAGLLRLSDPQLIDHCLRTVEAIEGRLSDTLRSSVMSRRRYGPGRRMSQVLPWQRDEDEARELLGRAEAVLIAACSDPDDSVAGNSVELVARWQRALLERDSGHSFPPLPHLDTQAALSPDFEAAAVEPDPALLAIVQQWPRLRERARAALQSVLDATNRRLSAGAAVAHDRQHGFAGALMKGLEPDKPAEARSSCARELVPLLSADGTSDALRLAAARVFASSGMLEGSEVASSCEGLAALLGQLTLVQSHEPSDAVRRPDALGTGPLVDALLRVLGHAGHADMGGWPHALLALRELWDRAALPPSRTRLVLDAVRSALIDSDSPKVTTQAVTLVERIGSSDRTPSALRDHAASVLLDSAATADSDKLTLVLHPIAGLRVSAGWRSRAVRELNVIREATEKDAIRDAVDAALALHKGPLEDRVFISYARQDQAFAIELSLALQDQGIFTWRDIDDIPKGAEWGPSIEAAVHGCGRMIVILTKSAVASDWVTNEWTRALATGKRIFPVVIEDCDAPAQLSALQHTHFVGQARPDRQTLLQLVRDLSRAR